MKMQKTVSIVVVNQNNQILLLKRAGNKQWYPGKWDIISGKLAECEDAANCFKRELFEETGIKNLEQIESGKPFVYQERGLKWLVHPYRCRIKQKDIKLNGEHCDYQWVSQDKLFALKLARPARVELKPFYHL